MLGLGRLLGVGVFAHDLGKYSSKVSGMLLILVGLHQVF